MWSVSFFVCPSWLDQDRPPSHLGKTVIHKKDPSLSAWFTALWIPICLPPSILKPLWISLIVHRQNVGAGNSRGIARAKMTHHQARNSWSGKRAQTEKTIRRVTQFFYHWSRETTLHRDREHWNWRGYGLHYSAWSVRRPGQRSIRPNYLIVGMGEAGDT